MKDNLENIFKLQKSLMELYGCKYPVEINSQEGQSKIREYMFYAVQELFEASNLLKMKPWKKTKVETDVTEFKEELADVLHFFIEVCIYCDISAVELTNMYSKKMFKNLERIKNGY